MFSLYSSRLTFIFGTEITVVKWDLSMEYPIWSSFDMKVAKDRQFFSPSRLPGDNPFYSNIDSMPEINPRRKQIPLVSELVSNPFRLFPFASLGTNIFKDVQTNILLIWLENCAFGLWWQKYCWESSFQFQGMKCRRQVLLVEVNAMHRSVLWNVYLVAPDKFFQYSIVSLFEDLLRDKLILLGLPYWNRLLKLKNNVSQP